MMFGLALLAAAYAYEPFPARTGFVVQDVGKNDAYYVDKDKFIGRECTSTKRLETRDGIWFAGPIACGTDEY